MRTPTIENKNVVNVISRHAKIVLMKFDAFRIATGTATNVMPTASASIEVATAIMNIVFTLKPSFVSSSSFEKASRSILMPMIESRMNASHGAILLMIDSKPEPSKKPKNGMSPWKPPNQMPQSRHSLIVIFLVSSPLQMDTANASIERPTANKIRPMIPIYMILLIDSYLHDVSYHIEGSDARDVTISFFCLPTRSFS